MTRSLIYTLEPLEQGGVIALVRAVTALNERHGHRTSLLYTATEQVPTNGRWSALQYFSKAAPRWVDHGEWRGLAIPHWPLPLWATYALPAALARSLIRGSEIQAVVSGSNHCGLPAALLRRRYLVWTATLYRDELEGRAAAGDPWPPRLLASRAWRRLEAEERLIFERAALILALSPHTAARIRESLPALADRVRVVLYPVDTETCKPSLCVPRSRAGRPFILLAARIRDPRKNVNLLLQAFARIRAARPDLALIVTGDDPLPETRALARKLDLESAVEFRGLVPRGDLIELYQSAELFVLPSLQEGLGISALEAMACGTPVVATRSGGPEGVIRDGETGRLVANGDAEALASAALELLADPARLEVMRARCAEQARAEFARPIVESQLLEAFRTVYPEHF